MFLYFSCAWYSLRAFWNQTALLRYNCLLSHQSAYLWAGAERDQGVLCTDFLFLVSTVTLSSKFNMVPSMTVLAALMLCVLEPFYWMQSGFHTTCSSFLIFGCRTAESDSILQEPNFTRMHLVFYVFLCLWPAIKRTCQARKSGIEWFIKFLGFQLLLGTFDCFLQNVMVHWMSQSR